MKRLKIAAACLLLLSLFGCSRSEFCDLSGFVYEFARGSDLDLEIEDFTFETKSDGTVYRTFFGEKGDEVMLSLESDEENRICCGRILICKYDSAGNPKAISSEQIPLFISAACGTMAALCSYDRQQSRSLLEEFTLYSAASYRAQGELTKQCGSFRFVYYSTALMSEMILYNLRLKDVEPTEKPESRPLFGDTTRLRNDETTKK
ncbi:MAG: hypothetical protein PUB43_03370 [Oscillospiraceae bacterium]|nr:hypothetical protein [Oscillospiraceae bacterium]